MDKIEFYNYLRKRSQILIKECKQLLGGKCVGCGAVNDLQFDHIDPSTKEFEISKARSVSRVRLLRELKKCQLLCRSCHLKKGRENGDVKIVQHGTVSMYKLYVCRCQLCCGAMRLKNRLSYYRNREERNKRRRERRRIARAVNSARLLIDAS